MRHKYNAKKTMVDGILFSSKSEANYYSKLVLLKRMGEITHIELQPKYEIIKPYPHPVTGKKVRGTYYIADFLVTYADGRKELVDIKGVRTEVYKLKKKLFEQQYGIQIVEVTA